MRLMGLEAFRTSKSPTTSRDRQLDDGVMILTIALVYKHAPKLGRMLYEEGKKLEQLAAELQPLLNKLQETPRFENIFSYKHKEEAEANIILTLNLALKKYLAQSFSASRLHTMHVPQSINITLTSGDGFYNQYQSRKLVYEGIRDNPAYIRELQSMLPP